MRFSIGFDDGALAASPAWTRIDTDYSVTSATISRGRSYETDEMREGRATVTWVDTVGDFDPTNAGGAYFGNGADGRRYLSPLRQAKIELVNPTDSSVNSLFRGFVSQWRFQPHPTERLMFVTVELVDALALFAAAEMVPNGDWGHQVVSGNIVFNEDTATTAVQARIVKVLDQFGWPGATASSATLRDIFTGNVKLQQTTYAPRSTVLSVIKDACDAEFPGGVAAFWMSKTGVASFRGRYARFHPDVVDYNIDTWQVGDQDAADADPTNVAPLSPPFSFRIEDTTLYTSGVALPEGVADGDINSTYNTDATAAGVYGTRTWSAENLVLLGGASSRTALQETELMSQYIVDNYATPRVRMDALTLRPQDPNGTYGDATWNLICGVELGDIVNVQTSSAWGGGFNADTYVEQIAYDIKPMKSTHDDVTLTLDVSPNGYFTKNPFEA